MRSRRGAKHKSSLDKRSKKLQGKRRTSEGRKKPIHTQVPSEDSARYKTLFRNACEAIFLTDLKGRIIETNKAARSLTGYSGNELVGKPLTFIHPKKEHRGIMDAFRKGLKTGSGFMRDVAVHTKTGGEIFVDAMANVIECNDERFVQAILRNVTRRREIEGALRKNVQKLTLAIEGSGGFPWECWFDPKRPGVTLDRFYLSPGAKRIVGYKDHELPNSIRAWHRRIIPEDLRRLKQSARAHLRGEKDFHQIEYRIRHKDGSIRWMRSCGRIERDADGKPQRWVGIHWDITRSSQMIDLLSESEQRYRSLVEGLPDIVWSFSTKRGTTYASSRVRSILGYSSNYLYKNPWLWNSSIHPDDHERVSKVIADFIKGKDFTIEYRIEDANGNWHWFLDRSVGRRRFRDEVIIEGVSTDITARKQNEEAIQRRDAILTAVSSIAEKFLRIRPWDRVVNNGLKMIGNAAGVCRAYVCQNNEDGDGTFRIRVLYEWTGPTCKPQRDHPAYKNKSYEEIGLGRWPRILSRGQPIHSPVHALPRSESTLFTAQGIRSIAIMPIFVAGKWWGFTGFNECRHEKDWSKAEIEALKAWAEMLSSAIHRRQIENRIAKHSAEQALLSNIARIVGSSLHLPDILERLMDKAMTVCDCEHGAIYLIDRKSRQYTGLIFRGELHRIMQELRALAFDAREIAHAVSVHQPILLQDSRCCPTLWNKLKKRAGMQTVLLIPLASGNTVQGILALATTKEKNYDDRELDLFSAIGSHAGYAIEKARLYNAAQRELAERRSLERELRQSEAKYRAIFDTAPAIILTLDLSGKVTSCNKTARAITGFRVSDVVGHRFSELALLYSADIPQFEAMLSQTLAGQLPPPFRIRWKTKTGEPRIAEIRVSTLKKGTKISAVQIIAQDITEREKAEEDLKESEDKFRTIAEQSLMGVSILQDNVIKYTNKAMADLYGYTVEEALSWKPMGFLKLFAPDTLKLVKEQAEKKQRGDPSQLVHYIVHGIKKNGDLIWADNFSRTISYKGRPADLVTQVDITERKQKELLIERRDAILEATAFGAEQFLSATNWTDVIQKVLQRLGKAADVSRVYLFRNHFGKNGVLLTSITHEWTAPGISPQLHNPKSRNVAYHAQGYGHWVRTMNKGKHIHGIIDRFPLRERKHLAAQNIRSILSTPIFVGNEWWGFIGFDECRYAREWSTAAIEALRIAANAIGAAIQRARAHEVLKYQADLLDDVSDAIISTDLKFRILSWNKAAEKMYGRKSQEVIGKAVTGVTQMKYPYDQRADVVRKFFKEGFWNGEVTQRHKNGTVIHVLTSVSIVKDITGNAVGAVAVNRDITLRKRAAMELEREHAKLRQYLDIAGVIIVVLNASGRVELINKKGCEILGYKEKKIVGKNWFDNYIPEKFRNDVRAVFAKTIAGNHHMPVIYENSVLTKSGEERLIEWHNMVLTDDTGKAIATLSSGADITEQRKAQEALTRSEAKYRSLIENTNVGIVSINPQGELTYVNSTICRMLGYHEDEFIGNPLSRFLHPEDREKTLQTFSGTWVGTKRPPYIEFRAVHRNGQAVHMLSNPTFIKQRGKTTEIHAIIENVTRRKVAESVVRRHLQLENRLAKLSERLVKASNIDSALNAALPDLGELFEVERVLLCQREERTKLWRITHEWHEKGLAPIKEKLPNIREGEYPGWVRKLKRQRYVSIIDTAQLPKSLMKEITSITNRRLKSILIIPLYAEKHLSGVLCLTTATKYSRWEKYDIEVLQAAGDVMLASMIRDRYQRRLTRTLNALDTERRNIVELARKTIEMQERERLYFASEIHDNLLQSLVAVLYYLQMLEIPLSERKMSKRKDKLVETIKASIESGRALIRDFEPLHAPEISLLDAVRNSIETRFIGTSTKFDFLHPKRLPRLGFASRINLLRIIQEALMNVRKHAHADHLRVDLRVENKKLLVDIRDDGVGFNQSALSSRPAGQIGLITMQERASIVGGKLSITSEPGTGTRVRGVFPLGDLRK